MGRREITPFPWAALDRLARDVENTLAATRRWLELGGKPHALAAALSAILGATIELHVRSVDAVEPAKALVRLGFRVGPAECVVGLEAGLAGALLAKLLRRPIPLVRSQSDLDASLLGALSALLVEAARRSGASEPLSPVEPSVPAKSALIHLTAIVEGRPYLAALWLRAEPALVTAPAARDFDRLLDVELALPLVVAMNAMSVADAARLEVGAGWFPGPGWLIDSKQEGRGILVAGASERGLGVELGPGTKIVLREATTAALAVTESMAESDDSAEPTTLPQAVLDAPLVVRVELGMVSMKAREWAALQPGDVLATGRRIAEPVALRAGGRLLARGELVNIEGELGVRVTEIVPEETP